MADIMERLREHQETFCAAGPDCPTCHDLLNELRAQVAALTARGEALEARLKAQTDLVERLCDAVDREAEDIGGESALTVLQLLGPNIAVARAALTERETRRECAR